MFDIGWSEFLVIIVIMLIVVGPKDLPRIVRTVGQWTGKARSYARDFQRTIEEAADETEMSAIRKEIELANKEIAEVQKTTINIDTSLKADDEAGPKAASTAGDASARGQEVEAASTPDTATSTVTNAVQAAETSRSSASISDATAEANPAKPG